MRAGILLSLREKATRLSGKVLKPLAGHATVTGHLIARLKASKRAAAVVVATSTDPRDGVLCTIAAEYGVPCFCGSLDDKLRRYRDAAEAHGLDFVVIVDGDDPFVSVEHVDRIIDSAASEPADYVIAGRLPVGATGFGVATAALSRICAELPESNTEVWGHLFTRNPAYTCRTLEEPDLAWRRPDIRMTLDYPEDYDFFTTVADGLAAEGRGTSFPEVMAWLSVHPEAIAINRDCSAKYEAHLKASSAIE